MAAAQGNQKWNEGGSAFSWILSIVHQRATSQVLKNKSYCVEVNEKIDLLLTEIITKVFMVSIASFNYSSIHHDVI